MCYLRKSTTLQTSGLANCFEKTTEKIRARTSGTLFDLVGAMSRDLEREVSSAKKSRHLVNILRWRNAISGKLVRLDSTRLKASAGTVHRAAYSGVTRCFKRPTRSTLSHWREKWTFCTACLHIESFDAAVSSIRSMHTTRE